MKVDVSFCTFSDRASLDGNWRPARMLVAEHANGAFADVSGTAWAGGSRVTVPAGKTHALIAVPYGAVRVAVGSDPTATEDGSSNGGRLIIGPIVEPVAVEEGQLISIIEVDMD
jgi:hypothetical protein